ncbi:MAG: hypothetical protein EOP89_08875 [Lysobacteraceae bacterium]|nr:MAG: hypothetical protein EOP89_08875 [Xanthomonadaceae bacterium]
MADPTTSEQLLLQSQIIDKLRRLADEQYALQFGVVGGGPRSNGTYPVTAMTGEIQWFKCPAQVAFDASQTRIIIRNGSNALITNAADSGAKLLVGNAGAAVTLTPQADIRPGWSILFEQFTGGKVQIVMRGSDILNHASGYDRTRARYSVASLTCNERDSGGNNRFTLTGDVTNVA